MKSFKFLQCIKKGLDAFVKKMEKLGNTAVTYRGYDKLKGYF